MCSDSKFVFLRNLVQQLDYKKENEQNILSIAILHHSELRRPPIHLRVALCTKRTTSIMTVFLRNNYVSTTMRASCNERVSTGLLEATYPSRRYEAIISRLASEDSSSDEGERGEGAGLNDR